MDTARGGYYENVPQQYPENAWFTYYDQTADYGTQITEYVYWATTTYLGGRIGRGEFILISRMNGNPTPEPCSRQQIHRS